jgi:plastocyanin
MRRVVALLVIAAVLSGCGGKSKVGNQSLLNFKDQAQQRLGGATPTPARTAAPAATAAPKGAVAAATPAPKAADEPAAIVIAINSDSVGTSFDPTVARVVVGAPVEWVNRDSSARSVEADGGQFDSGPIKPGASWSWTPTAAGKINYHDGTRPYAVAALEVAAK